MSRGAQKTLSVSKKLRPFNMYVEAMYKEYAPQVLDEVAAEQFKGQWKERVFHAPSFTSLDLEIGTGVGEHIAFQAFKQPQRLFIGMELKYKPLVKTARRLKKQNSSNAKVIRHNGRLIHRLFQKHELAHVYIHFPDPWPKTKHQKHRLIHPEFVKNLYYLQQPGSIVEIKTDSLPYLEHIKKSFKTTTYCLKNASQVNYHAKTLSTDENITTAFERIFIKKKAPVYYLKYQKPSL